MNIIPATLSDLLIIKVDVFEDQRGYFFESYNKEKFISSGLNVEFVQDNQSLSQGNVLRGLHFQNPPFEQGKLVRVIKGAVLDVAVDIRKNSSTYGKYFTIELTEKNKIMMWIPPGFAHGFLTLSDETIFFYKCTNFYNKASEQTIQWDDKNLGIPWNAVNPIVSEKDKHGIPFKEFISLF